MRRKLKNKNIVKPDIVWNSEKIGKFTNYVMDSGKKSTASRIVLDMMNHIKEVAKVEDPMEIFELALKNTEPQMEVRSRRVGGANYQVPREVRPERRRALSMKWIIEAARSKKGKPIAEKLALEIIEASKNLGEAVKKRENTHKMADANKAFAHFAW